MKTNYSKHKKLFHLKLLLSFLFISSVNAQISGPSTIESGATANYQTYPTTDNYFWSTTGGLEIIGSNTGNTVTVQKNFSSVGTLYLVAYNNALTTNPNSGYCDNINISIPSCNVPTRTIVDYLCITDSHPYWRLEIPAVSGATYQWTSQHFTFLGGGTTSNYVIGNPTDNGSGFTVYCKISKTCSNGSTDERTFFYESNSTNSCGQATTGEVGGSTGGGGEILFLKTVPRQSIEPLSNTKNEAIIYPNPFEEKITLSFQLVNKQNVVTVKIYDSFGKLVLTPLNNKTIKQDANIEIDTAKLPKNKLYFALVYVNGKLNSEHKLYSKL